MTGDNHVRVSIPVEWREQLEAGGVLKKNSDFWQVQIRGLALRLWLPSLK